MKIRDRRAMPAPPGGIRKIPPIRLLPNPAATDLFHPPSSENGKNRPYYGCKRTSARL